MRDQIKTIISGAIGPVYGAETYINQATDAIDGALAASLAVLRREARDLGASQRQVDAALIAAGLMDIPEPPAPATVPASTVSAAIAAAEQHIAEAQAYLDRLRSTTGL